MRREGGRARVRRGKGLMKGPVTSNGGSLYSLIPVRFCSPGKEGCIACQSLEEEVLGRMKERREKFGERVEEIEEGKGAWKLSTICFPSLAEGLWKGGGDSVAANSEGVWWLSSEPHGSSCIYSRVPKLSVVPFIGRGVWPVPLGTGGWQLEFKVSVTLSCRGDVPGP